MGKEASVALGSFVSFPPFFSCGNKKKWGRRRMSNYGIVGFGCAGFQCVKAIRELDSTGEICVYSDTPAPLYNPMLTTYYVAGKLDLEGVFPFGSVDEVAQNYRLTMASSAAVKLDSARREITGADGTTRAYDKILISSGAKAIVPQVPGFPAEHIYTMRTLEDAKRLKAVLATAPPKRAIVVGASMVGIKLVEIFHNLGIETVLADLAPRIFSAAAYQETSEIIEQRLSQRGIGLRMGRSVASARQVGEGYLCTLSDGEELETDMLVMCIGTFANVATADESVHINRGIVVNDRLETSAEGIYAAGDCCEGNNLQSGQSQVIGLWANAFHQGRCAGINMAGGSAAYTGNVLHNITHFMDMDFIGLGDVRLQGEVLVCENQKRGLYVRAVRDNGVLAGVNILDNYRISGILKNYFLGLLQQSKGAIPAFQQGLLLREGLSQEFIWQLEEGRR